MTQWIVNGGPLMLLIVLLTLVILALAIKKSIDLFWNADQERERLERGLSAILFWGCVCAVIGFLGQFMGLYLSLQAIREAGVVSPPMLAQGLAVSLITPVSGLVVLLVSATIWFGLRWRLRQLAADPGRGARA